VVVAQDILALVELERQERQTLVEAEVVEL
jgi:hypothetical protein